MLLIRKLIISSFLALLNNISQCSFTARIDVQYCGFEQRCGGNHTRVVANKNSCCQPCECVDVCKERDTCCADVEGLNDIEEVVKQQCLPAEFVPNGLMASKNTVTYYVRSHCPKSFNDIVVKEQCEKQTNDSIEELAFVSSTDGSIIYKNKFCGLCHGDKTTEPWTMFISRRCLTMLPMVGATLKSVNKKILANCKISMIEPSGLQIKQTVCFDDESLIGRCNQTGQWNVYNKTLEDLCHHPTGAVNYFFQTMDKLVGFRSVYCYLCNTKGTSSGSLKCELLFSRTPGAFSGILKQAALTGSKDLQESPTACNDDEILDTEFDICRRLYCPLFFLPNAGQCKPFLDTYLSYSLVVELVFLKPTLKSDFLKQDLSSLNVGIVKPLGLIWCKACYFAIFVKKDVNKTMLSEVYLDVSLAPKKKYCDIEYLFSKITAFEMSSSKINIMLNRTTFSFKALWNNESLWRADQYEKIYTSKITLCGKGIPAENISKCAKVKLGTQEYQSVLKNHVNANELLFAPVKEDMNGTMFVCVDKYIVHSLSAVGRAKSSLALAFVTLISRLFL